MDDVILSFGTLSALLLLGKFLRVKVRLFQDLYLPASLIGGVLGLVLISLLGPRIPESWTRGWAALPGILINVVFAVLFLGARLPSVRTVWNTAGPQLAYGQIVALGQYVVGLGVVLLVLGPLFGVPPLFGVIVPVGFEGGHGTAAGLESTFVRLGWAEGKDLGLASATIGMVSAIVVGIVLLNWAARRGHVREIDDPRRMSPTERSGIVPAEKREMFGRLITNPASIDSLALQLAFVGLAILIGYVMKATLLTVAAWAADGARAILAGFPLFPLCMIGGLIVQWGLSRFSRQQLTDHGLMERIGGLALDFLVVAAVATIRLDAVARDIVPLLLVCAAGVLWNVFCVLWLARRLLPTHWFERAIAEMGQSMGVTATGLLLLRAADPRARTDAPAAFAMKQMLHEPFMGGGLWTSTAVILVALQGGWFVLFLAAALITAWLVVWLLLWRKLVPGPRAAP